MNFFSPDTILVRAPNWIGDQIMAYPFFHFLRRAYPKSKIICACVSWVEDVQFRNLVDEVVVLPRAVVSGVWAKVEALEAGARLLKKSGPFDLAICLPNSFSSGWIQFRAGAKQRRGYATDNRGFLLTDKESWDRGHGVHRSQAYVNLLPKSEVPQTHIRDFFGIPAENDLDPGVPGVIPRFEVDRAWPHSEKQVPPDFPYWVLAPGSVAESRRWFESSFSTLAQMIFEKTGKKGLVVGGPTEAPIASHLEQTSNGVLIDYAGRGPVTSYAKVFQSSAFTVSNDSGLAHVASLCGSSVYVIWGAGDPNRTQPLGPGKVKIIFNPIDCWPCERNVCLREDGRKLECLEGIQPEIVFKEMVSYVTR
ncbi:MAG: glycosyltransferase family 9 protein [Bdellovibrionota bacterium]